MPPEVIFILILIVFSILEGALRGKKGSGTGGLPGPGRTPDWPEGPDDRAQPTERDRIVRAEQPERPRETADQMVPDDIWEEIAALARGDVEETLRRRRERGRGEAAPDSGRRTPLPTPRPVGKRPPSPVDGYGRRSAQPPPPRVPSPPVPMTPPGKAELAVEEVEPGARAERVPWQPRPTRIVSPAWARSGEEPASPTADGLAGSPIKEGEISGSLGETEAQRQERLHHTFRGAHALRHAVIAREVLGRPLALRDYQDDELWSQ